MADETLNITVSDNGSTTTVTNNLVKLATAAETVADSTSKVTAAAGSATTALNNEAAAAGKAGDAHNNAARSVKGYTDAAGNYIRVISQGNTVVASGVASSKQLASTINATSIEAGRAAAGYGALNSATATSASANAAFNTSVRALNQELGTYGSAAGAAGNATNSARTATEGASNANNGLRDSANSAGNSVNNLGNSHRNTGNAAEQHGDQVVGVRSRYGAFNETIQSAIRQLGLLAVGFASIGAATAASDQIQATNAIRNTAQTAEATATAMKELDQIQKSLGVGINTLAQQWTIGAAQLRSLNQGTDGLALTMQQLGNLAMSNGASFAQYSKTAGDLFATFKGGISTQATYNAIWQQGQGFANALLQAYQRMSGVMGNNEAVNRQFFQTIASGNLSMSQLAMLVNNATQALNAQAPVPVTLESAYHALTGSLAEWIGTSTQGNIITGALSAAMLELSQYPGVLVAGFTALAAAVALIGFAALVTAITTLIPLFSAIGSGIAFVVTVGGTLSAWTTAAIGLFTGLVAWLYKNAEAYDKVSDSMGIISQWNATLAKGIKTVIDWVGNAVTAFYEWVKSFKFVGDAVSYVSGLFGDMKKTVADWIDNFNDAAVKASHSFSQMTSKTVDFNTTIGGTAKPMASIVQLMKDGSGQALTFSDATGSADKSVTGLGTSLGSTNGALGSYSNAIKDAASGTGTFDSALSHLQQQLKGTQQSIGEFTQAQIDANSNTKNSQGQTGSQVSAYYGPGGGYNSSVYTGHGGGSSGFSISGNNGYSGGQGAYLHGASGFNLMGGSDPFFDVSIPFGGMFATGGSFKVQGAGGTDSTPVSFMATPGEQVVVLTPEQQASLQNLSPTYGDAGVASALGGAGMAMPYAPSAGAAAASGAGAGVAGSTAAGNAAGSYMYPGSASLSGPVTAPTAANSNASSANLPDLLLQCPGHHDVGDSVTQTTYDWGGSPSSNTPVVDGPSPDVINRMNGDDAAAQLIQALSNMRGGGGMGAATQSRTPVVNINIKADDYGQFKRSQRQIAMDLGASTINALAG